MPLTVKSNRGVYINQVPGTAGMYYVYLYCLGTAANVASWPSGFSIQTSATIGGTISYASHVTNQLTNPTFYSGDFNLFSGTGMVYAGDVSISLRAPACTEAA